VKRFFFLSSRRTRAPFSAPPGAIKWFYFLCPSLPLITVLVQCQPSIQVFSACVAACPILRGHVPAAAPPCLRWFKYFWHRSDCENIVSPATSAFFFSSGFVDGSCVPPCRVIVSAGSFPKSPPTIIVFQRFFYSVSLPWFVFWVGNGALLLWP